MCVLDRCSEVFDRLSISRPETFISGEFLRHLCPLKVPQDEQNTPKVDLHCPQSEIGGKDKSTKMEQLGKSISLPLRELFFLTDR